MELSVRLQTIADMVTPGKVLADIGTDHGYIPIWLVKNGITPNALAMDIRKGPLDRAREHVRQEGLEEKIILRLSDGMKELKAGEAQTAVIAGMGGGLIIHIMEDSPDLTDSLDELILSPQSEVENVRRWLDERGYSFLDEKMVEEEGKYYPVMKILPHAASVGQKKKLSRVECRFGPLLLMKKDPVLIRYLMFEKRCLTDILGQLEGQSSSGAEARRKSVNAQLEEIQSLLDRLQKS